MIEKALHNIIPRSLVEETKGTISFVDKRSGYEIRLFNQTGPSSKTNDVLLKVREHFFLFLCFSGPSREKKLSYVPDKALSNA